MRLPCCLVTAEGQPVLARHAHDGQVHHHSAGHQQKHRIAATASAMASLLRLPASMYASVFSNNTGGNMHNQRREDATQLKTKFIGLALFLTSVLTDIAPLQPTMAVATSITATPQPSVLDQLASFLALEDASAEEEEEKSQARNRNPYSEVRRDSDSGSSAPLTLSHHPSPHAAAGRIRLLPTLEHTGSFARPVVAKEDRDFVLLAETFGAMGSVVLKNNNVVDGFASSVASSRSTIAGTSHSGDLSSESSRRSTPVVDAEVSVRTHNPYSAAVLGVAARQPTHSAAAHCQWRQESVLDLAFATCQASFVAATQDMLSRGLFPTVYAVALDDVCLPASYVDVHRDARWKCSRCGKRHTEVREACVACRQPQHGVTKLFMGQLRKEERCEDMIAKLLFATLPELPTPLRLEGHVLPGHQHTAPRGKGCGSVYLASDDADAVVHTLHRNVFIDEDPETKQEIIFFAYAEQREWLELFAATRISRMGAQRSRTLPGQLLVCEVSGQSVRNDTVHHGTSRFGVASLK